MPTKVSSVRWKCPQCGKSRWLKPHQARKRKVCSRECLYASHRVEHPVRAKPSVRKTYGERVCEECGETYVARTKTQKFCSGRCSIVNTQRRRYRQDVLPRPCENCGTVFRPRPRSAGRFCTRACFNEGFRGAAAGNWRGGRHVTADGYVMVSAAGHPQARGHGNYVSEHRIVMEQMLGRELEAGETVHHVNGDRADNRPENLQVRKGRHGNGLVHRCADCGSTNIVSEPIS